MVALRLLLVRHGLSSFNLQQRIQGRNDLSSLTETGEEQARMTGQALKELDIEAVYSSPLERAAKTTKNLVGEWDNAPTPQFDQGLLEVELGCWSGMSINEVKEKFPKEYKVWGENPKKLVLKREDGSSFQPIKDLTNQARDFIQRLLKIHPLEKDTTVLIIAHNAILRCLILEMLNQPKQGFRRLKLDNASLSVINLKPSLLQEYEVQIECLNSTTHLTQSISKKGSYARIILVRHGETNWNLEGRFQGQIDIPLNTKGQAQAAAAGSFLSMVNIDRAFSSSMTRPIQTAEAILRFHKDIELEIKQGLVEIGHGLWEGKLEKEIQEEWPKLLKAWQDTPEAIKMPEGESIQEVWDRALASWENISSSLAPNETALVVAHDAVNKTILCQLLGLTPADIWKIKQGNGGISVIDISGDSNQPDVLTSLNLTSHLGGLIDSTASGAL